MTVRVYPNVKTTSASNGPANQVLHRDSRDVNTLDQLSSVVLLGLAVTGGVVADLLIALLV
ncbi:hypothetical protein M446_1867 [Methylobacterium sp. 4-46]|uniref:hypothetical protein n=1 Tax=unclassified Methylobacterium TaxID=2615210 RepID=UPI000165C9BC|nr:MULTISPECIES: hypothetical protein [Methylobacterium]ACA16349.1 hypothetical protein M446_1867 [Methylobacterium sp. 4-46]WFT83754.1 hypothetical protein QA634_09455 [Methylobacterium nodulans]